MVSKYTEWAGSICVEKRGEGEKIEENEGKLRNEERNTVVSAVKKEGGGELQRRKE